MHVSLCMNHFEDTNLSDLPTHSFRFIVSNHIIQICSGITSGRVLNGELYAQGLQKLSYLLSVKIWRSLCYSCHQYCECWLTLRPCDFAFAILAPVDGSLRSLPRNSLCLCYKVAVAVCKFLGRQYVKARHHLILLQG